MNLVEKNDIPWFCFHLGVRPRNSRYQRVLKRQKSRIERRRAKIDPECVPAYGRYRGWAS